MCFTIKQDKTQSFNLSDANKYVIAVKNNDFVDYLNIIERRCIYERIEKKQQRGRISNT